MNIRLILFDIGNVLVELGGAGLIRERSNKEFSDSYFWETWPSIQEVIDFETGKIDLYSFSKSVIAFYDLSITPKEFISVFRGGAIRKYPGVDELLVRLSNCYKIACLTNTNPIHWPKIRDEFELGKFFQKCYISYELGLLKPDKKIYKHVLEDTGLEPQEILFVDDNIGNIRSAESLGFQCCHVCNFQDVEARISKLLEY